MRRAVQAVRHPVASGMRTAAPLSVPLAGRKCLDPRVLRHAGRIASTAQPEGGIMRGDMNAILEKERRLAEAEAGLVRADLVPH